MKSVIIQLWWLQVSKIMCTCVFILIYEHKLCNKRQGNQIKLLVTMEYNVSFRGVASYIHDIGQYY